MTTDSWHNFADSIDSLIHQHSALCSMTDQSITNLTQLNKYWNLLRDHILKAARATISHYKTSSNNP